MKKAFLAALLLVGVYALVSQSSGPDPICNPRVQICPVVK